MSQREYYLKGVLYDKFNSLAFLYAIGIILRVMIKARDFSIFSIQTSIFTPTLQFSQSKVLAQLVTKFANTFDGDPISIPLPPDAPQEIPRLTLRDSNGKLKFEIAPNRANFFRYCKEDDAAVIEEDVFNLCLPIFDEYIKIVSARVGRLAIVSVKILQHETPGVILAQHFCKDKWLTSNSEPENFEVHFHRRYGLETFKVNNWLRCKSGILAKENARVVIVEQDINTLSEDLDEKEFNMNQISSFLKNACGEQRHQLAVYFPINE